eukprot:3703698-Amphidinium_carterae.1
MMKTHILGALCWMHSQETRIQGDSKIASHNVKSIPDSVTVSGRAGGIVSWRYVVQDTAWRDSVELVGIGTRLVDLEPVPILLA